jgi:hypothetical protein
MKKLIPTLVIGFALATAAANAQVVVRIGPPPPPQREVVVVRPSPRHVWIHGFYRWDGVRYVWAPGYWVLPPRPHAYWVDGHWAERHGGWFWVEGHWRG